MPRNSSRMTSAKEAMRTAFYFTDLDLSRPDGPTVNEREFIGSLVRVFAGDATLALTDAGAGAPEATGAEVVPLVERSGGLLRSKRAVAARKPGCFTTSIDGAVCSEFPCNE